MVARGNWRWVARAYFAESTVPYFFWKINYFRVQGEKNEQLYSTLGILPESHHLKLVKFIISIEKILSFFSDK